MKTAAAILVGGKGTRLRPLVSDTPKPLALINGKPFLFLLLEELAANEIREIILLTGYLHDLIVDACKDGTQFGVKLTYSRELEPLGTAGALANAQDWLQNYDDFLLLNGDTYFEHALSKLIDQKLINYSFGIISVCIPDNAQRYGTVVVDKAKQQVLGFKEKSGMEAALVNAGMYKLSKKILQCIPKGCFCSLETDIFPKLLTDKLYLQVLNLQGNFCDIGLPESYAQFNTEQSLKSIANTPWIARVLIAFALSDLILLDSQGLTADQVMNIKQTISDLAKNCNAKIKIIPIVFFDINFATKAVILSSNPNHKNLYDNLIYIPLTLDILKNTKFEKDHIRQIWENIKISRGYINPNANVIQQLLN